MTATVDSRTLRRRALIWLSVVLGVGIVVGLIWATGGFERGARPYMGPEVEPGEWIETRFWDVAVHEVVIDRPRGEIVVDVDVTNKLPDSTVLLTSNLIMIRIADGEVLFSSYCSITERSSFGPLIPTNARCRFGWEASDVPEPPPGDAEVSVMVLDQKMFNAILEGAQPRSSVPAGHVEFVAVDIPEEDL